VWRRKRRRACSSVEETKPKLRFSLFLPLQSADEQRAEQQSYRARTERDERSKALGFDEKKPDDGHTDGRKMRLALLL
jgi:hypothetical protein